MSKGNTFENDLLLKVFNNTAFSWDAITALEVALHTADPGEGGAQNTSEVSYPGYARVATNRNSGAWTVVGNQVTNVGLVQFPKATGGDVVATHISVGIAHTGAGQILYKGQLDDPLSISNGIQPQFEAGEIALTED